ncbi:peptidylprolyl isomerase [Marinobacter panjinensis]|uniref:Periplasmic chaperone PpiD n=1 Tax=Marinobacter panjinensis TaxID=2576384 RepID=A0A4U6R151_9GAMM|nr:SurA N-terminal domain-containing protein [Marinobacter panjinensis]MCR8913953.1 SurA N-terminal domain-containing protein [Marinobacter panjinensis]TKV67414.1 peptidylprolyl isomerase [Marinobacter panjinensis]
MLQDIRDNAQGTIAKVIIGLLIVSLSIWGMDAIVGGFSGEPEVATVNGDDITEREFLRVVQIESQRRLSQMDNPDPSLLDEDQIRQDVLESLIQEKVLTQDAGNQGLELSGQDIDSLITQMPQFQVDGSFNRDRFVATVRNMGMGVGEFRETMRKQYVVNQIRAGIAQSGIVAKEHVAQLLRIQNQTRDFRMVTLAEDTVSDQVEVTEAEIEAYYQNNQDAFQQSERVDAQYIALSRETLAEMVDVSDDELRDYYQERSSELAREERRAAHILIEDGEDAEETISTIQERLSAGEDFSELAEEYSVDTVSAEEGGDLGFAGRGVYDEAFEEALFQLEKGEVSEPVSTSFGIHLIKLLDVQKSEVPPLEELEDELRRELARSKAEERFAEVRTELADLAYAADDLDGPAQDLGLEVREKSNITRDGGEAPFDHQGLVRQLFSEDVLQDGFNTELIDVGDNMSVVARVAHYQEAQQQPLDEVSDEIRAALTRQKTREALDQRAEAIISELESGKDLQEMGIGEWQSYDDQPRNNPTVGGAVMSRVFSLQRPEGDEEVYGSVMSDNGVAIIALEAVNEGNVNREGAEFSQLRTFLASLEGQREYQAYQQYLRERAEVERQ